MAVNRTLPLLLLVMLSSLPGCASVPLAFPEIDRAAKSFAAPTPGKAGLYLFRDYTYLIGDDRTSVYLDGSYVGETSNMTYLYLEVEPGQRTLSLRNQSSIAGYQPDPSNTNTSLEMERGKTYFVRQYRHAIIGHDTLKPVSEEAGKQGVLRCKLADTVPYEPPLNATAPAVATAARTTAFPAAAEAGIDLTGTYASVTTNAAKRLDRLPDPEVRLVQQGNRITGLYGDFNLSQQGKIFGELADGTIKFEWYAVDGNYGKGSWNLGADGTEFDGKWYSLSTQSGSGQWNLIRVDNLANADLALLNRNVSNDKSVRGKQTDNTGWLFLLLFFLVKGYSDLSAW